MSNYLRRWNGNVNAIRVFQKTGLAPDKYVDWVEENYSFAEKKNMDAIWASINREQNRMITGAKSEAEQTIPSKQEEKIGESAGQPLVTPAKIPTKQGGLPPESTPESVLKEFNDLLSQEDAPIAGDSKTIENEIIPKQIDFASPNPAQRNSAVADAIGPVTGEEQKTPMDDPGIKGSWLGWLTGTGKKEETKRDLTGEVDEEGSKNSRQAHHPQEQNDAPRAQEDVPLVLNPPAKTVDKLPDQPELTDDAPNRNPAHPGAGDEPTRMRAQTDGMASRVSTMRPSTDVSRAGHKDYAVKRADAVDRKGNPINDPNDPNNLGGGDQMQGNQDRDFSEATLRPRYGVAGPEQVIPSGREQLKSDIAFDVFSVVQPGFGEGAENKLFLYEQAHEKLIHFAPPFYGPGQWLGPLNTQRPMPWQWQNVKSKQHIDRYESREQRKMKLAVNQIHAHGEGSAAAFGRDVPELPVSRTSSGLPRDGRSPFEPVIHNFGSWTTTVDPPGHRLNRRGFKRLHSAWRDPDVRETQRDNGGPHLNKRRSLEVILP